MFGNRQPKMTRRVTGQVWRALTLGACMTAFGTWVTAAGAPEAVTAEDQPPAFVNVDATATGGTVLVAWTAEGESGILIYQVRISREGGPFQAVGDPLPVSGEGTPYAVAFALDRGTPLPQVRVEALLPDGTSLASTTLRVRGNSPNLGGHSIRQPEHDPELTADPEGGTWPRTEAGASSGDAALARIRGNPWAPNSYGRRERALPHQTDDEMGEPLRDADDGPHQPPHATLEGRRLTVYWVADGEDAPESVNLRIASGEPRRFRMVAKGLEAADGEEGFVVELSDEEALLESADPLFIRVEATFDGDGHVLSEPIEVARL